MNLVVFWMVCTVFEDFRMDFGLPLVGFVLIHFPF